MDTVAQWDAEQNEGEGSISANLKPPSNSYALRQPELSFACLRPDHRPGKSRAPIKPRLSRLWPIMALVLTRRRPHIGIANINLAVGTRGVMNLLPLPNESLRFPISVGTIHQGS